MLYGKFFRSAYTGSMYGAGFHVFAVWGFAISNADSKGFVDLNPRAVAPALGGSIQEVEAALEYLQRPDPDSRSSEAEGRRIVREGAFLFRIVNYERYKGIKDEESKRELDRERQRRYRQRAESDAKSRHDLSRDVTPCHARHELSQEIAYKDKEKDKEKEESCAEVLSHSALPPLVPERGSEFVYRIVGKGGPSWEAPQALIEMLARTFPNVDTPAEMAKAALWSETNPTKRKTARGMPAFLARWMEKASNKLGTFHEAGTGHRRDESVKKPPTSEEAAILEASRRELAEDHRAQLEELAARRARSIPPPLSLEAEP